MTTDRLDALRLAAKRLRRLALECPPGSSIRNDACEWAAEADDALRAVSGSVGGEVDGHLDMALRIDAATAAPQVAGEATTTCQCGAPCREEVLERGGDYGWGDDKSRTVLRYVPPAPTPAQSVSGSVGGEVAWQLRMVLPDGRRGSWRTMADGEPRHARLPDGFRCEYRPLYATAAPQVDGEATEADVVALVAGPYKWHHKMNELQEREAKAFDRCRELTIQNVRTFFATRKAMLAAAPAPAQSEPPAEGGNNG